MTDLTEAEIRRIVRQEILVHVMNEHRLDYDLNPDFTIAWDWPRFQDDSDG